MPVKYSSHLYDPSRFRAWSNVLEADLGIRNWDTFDRNIATLYLTALSSLVAQRNGLALATDRPGLRALAESIQIGYPVAEAVELEDATLPPISLGRPSKVSAAEAEVALGLRFTVRGLKVQPETTPAKIIAFREKHQDELGNLRTKLADLANSIAGDYPSRAAFQQAVEDLYRNSIDPAVSALERALRGQRIQTQVSAISVASLASAPAVLAQAIGSSPIGTTIGLTAGAALAITVQMAKSRAVSQRDQR